VWRGSLLVGGSSMVGAGSGGLVVSTARFPL